MIHTFKPLLRKAIIRKTILDPELYYFLTFLLQARFCNRKQNHDPHHERSCFVASRFVDWPVDGSGNYKGSDQKGSDQETDQGSDQETDQGSDKGSFQGSHTQTKYTEADLFDGGTNCLQFSFHSKRDQVSIDTKIWRQNDWFHNSKWDRIIITVDGVGFLQQFFGIRNSKWDRIIVTVDNVVFRPQLVDFHNSKWDGTLDTVDGVDFLEKFPDFCDSKRDRTPDTVDVFVFLPQFVDFHNSKWDRTIVTVGVFVSLPQSVEFHNSKWDRIIGTAEVVVVQQQYVDGDNSVIPLLTPCSRYLYRLWWNHMCFRLL